MCPSPGLTSTEQCPNLTQFRHPLRYFPSGSKTVRFQMLTHYITYTWRQQKTFIYAEQTGIIRLSCKQLPNLVFKQYLVDIVVNSLQLLSNLEGGFRQNAAASSDRSASLCFQRWSIQRSCCLTGWPPLVTLIQNIGGAREAVYIEFIGCGAKCIEITSQAFVL